jgi:hypothetical protein
MAPDPVLLGLRGSRDTSVFARPRWNAPEPASSRRQGPGSASTCPSATWTWPLRTPNWSAGAGLLWHGAQLAVDATLTSPVARDGKARHAGVAVPGDALQRATARKRTTTYTEFAQNRRCRLVVVAMETSGLWGSEAVLAHAKARGTLPWLRPTTVGAYIHRWAALLGIGLPSTRSRRRSSTPSFPPSTPSIVSRSGGGNPLHRSPFPYSRLPPARGGTLTRRKLCEFFKK